MEQRERRERERMYEDFNAKELREKSVKSAP
jgi:hypothetical protein